MHSITVKNIPPDIYERLKQSAKVHRRSINSEIIVIIEDALRSRKVDPEDFLARARLIREKTADYMIDEDEFTAIKKAGRK